jgi:hypothetical protein
MQIMRSRPRFVEANATTNPSLGVDVIRDARSGKMYVLETNPYGDSWTLTSGSGRNMEKQFGLDFHAQFNAISTITEASIEAARRFAA